MKVPPPLLSINFFATGRFLKHSTEGFTYQIYRHCETKNFRRKNVIPPSMHKIFRYPKFSETFKVCSRNFSALWDKKISIENLESPPPLLSINFFATGRFLKHSTEGFTYQIYRHCETKNFRRKNVIPPSMHKYFRYPKISETFKGCPRIFLALWDKKFSTEKRDTPFFIHIFFETKNFLKNSRISLRKFSALWDKNFSTEKRDTP